MRRSKAEIYVHLVWATKQRQPLLTPEREREIYRCVIAEAERMGCVIQAIGGMPDHVHLVVRIPTTLSVGELMKRVKGVSSALANDLSQHNALFRWQEGYGAFSVSRSHVPSAVAYVIHQKQRHAENNLDLYWEETDEEPPTANEAF